MNPRRGMLGPMDPQTDTVQSEPTGWTFFRQWLKSPLSIAAISPSSRHLARQMIAELPKGTRRVIELGGGTGVFTQALLDHGVAGADLLVLELNQELHHFLQRRFPAVRMACADARDLFGVADRTGFLDHGPVDAVVSGLGLLSMAKSMQRQILDAAFSVMQPEGRFIQFTYGPASPVAGDVVDSLELDARRGNIAWLNIPPATVYVYTRRRAKPARADRPRP
jgi:phosphatidylethanolamine/phosphatidyl-N-methylethanolamine N-methyltransferase